MEQLLTKVTQQAMNYAIRSGIAITGGYALSQCSRLLKTRNGQETQELERLQRLLEGKIRIISPAIDMIELIAARGNSSLESAVALTKSLRWDIQTIGIKLSDAAEAEELARNCRSSNANSHTQREADLCQVTSDLRALLQKIEDSVPLINLAITTSGVNLSNNLPVSVSPSRLLQASAFLSGGDTHYHNNPSHPTQIGPLFTMSMYMLFSGHSAKAREEQHFRSAMWKEVIHKAQVKLFRTSLSRIYDLPGSNSTYNHEIEDSKFLSAEIAQEFAYQIIIVEDLDDGRFHSQENDTSPQIERFDGIPNPGIRHIFPIHEVSKIFYADTGKVLNLGSNDEINNPVLLIKRDPCANFPRRLMRAESESPISNKIKTEDGQSQICNHNWSLPPGLDPEWIAFEVYCDEPYSDEEESGNETSSSENPGVQPTKPSRQPSLDPTVVSDLSRLHIKFSSSLASNAGNELTNSSRQSQKHHQSSSQPQPLTSLPMNIRTSLSLFEMLIRLTSLQQFQQASHLTINDELLNFFLEDSSTTGAAPGDSDARKRIRMAARRQVGFDPYDESPIKRRGEQYQNHRDSPVPRRLNSNEFPSTPSPKHTLASTPVQSAKFASSPPWSCNSMSEQPSPGRESTHREPETPGPTETKRLSVSHDSLVDGSPPNNPQARRGMNSPDQSENGNE